MSKDKIRIDTIEKRRDREKKDKEKIKKRKKLEICIKQRRADIHKLFGGYIQTCKESYGRVY